MPSGHFRLGVPSGHGAERARRVRPTALSTGSPNDPEYGFAQRLIVLVRPTTLSTGSPNDS